MDADRGSERIRGLGARKQAVLNNGGAVFDLAVAMLETKTMTADYPSGDVYPGPDKKSKTGDAANFGIFKQNWFMIRQAYKEFVKEKLGPGDYHRGFVLNTNLGLDIKVLHASQVYWTLDRWFAGHRNGPSGLENPDTADIKRYRDAVYWIRGQINSQASYLADDTRFWVHVEAI
jgi:hypothetical protein